MQVPAGTGGEPPFRRAGKMLADQRQVTSVQARDDESEISEAA
jgi:hypothetical protein